MGKTLSSGHLVQNICTMKNGRYALEITDVTEFNSNGNKVIGTARYAFKVGD
jgi:hypothetical protein